MNAGICGLGITVGAGAPPPAGSGASTIMLVGWLAIVFAIFYFMAILPQKRREKERKKLLEALKTGDKVLFGGGIIGVIANIKDHIIVIKVSEGVKVEVLKGAVTRVIEKDDELKNTDGTN